MTTRASAQKAAATRSVQDNARKRNEERRQRDTTDILGAAMRVEQAQAELRAEVEKARRLGTSWEKIGDILGVSRQAAFKRFR